MHEPSERQWPVWTSVTLPPLETVVLASDDGAERPLSEARAAVARLRLDLRTAEHDARLAERAVAESGGEINVDLARAEALLRAAVAPRLAADRARFAAEVDEAHARADELVSRARAKARTMVAEAQQELSRALDGGHTGSYGGAYAATTPVVRESRIIPSRLVRPRSITWFDEPYIPAPEIPAHEIPAPEIPAPEPAPEPVVPDRRPPEPQASPEPPASAPALPTARRSGSFRRRFLHLDVVLPLLAGLIVLLVLLAWAG